MKLKLLFLSLLFSLPIAAQDADIKILCVNDLHSAIQNFPKFAYLVDSIRSKHPDVLLFSAGDNRTGNPLNDKCPEPNRPMVEMMNAIGFNMSTMGNHECDCDPSGYAFSINNSAFPYVCANAYPADSLKIHTQPFRIFEHQGVRIAVLGVVSTNEKNLIECHPDRIKGFRFTTPDKEIENYSWLRNQCDVYIGLTHLGFPKDKEVAEKYGQFDLIVGGHSHDLVPGEMVNGVMIVQAKRDLTYLNEVDLKVRGGKVVDKKCKTYECKYATGVHPKIKAMLDEYSAIPEFQRVLGKAVNDFEQREELGCFMADALKWGAKADLAIVNAGGVRYSDKEAGDITVNDILRLDPFGNKLVCVEITGEELVKALDEMKSLDEYGPPYVAGFKYTISMEKKRADVKLTNEDGSKFNMKKTYKVAMSDFTSITAKSLASKTQTDTEKSTAGIIMEYVEMLGTVDYKGVTRMSIKGLNHR
ncbi:MAG: bifunctional metallophosphatase/5'-nucleotidase [Bacteroidaceae bacterium]|nr:bifunctional metallophosphatase/5'-nucleotidase [Bacteroidaceae bacterium]